MPAMVTKNAAQNCTHADIHGALSNSTLYPMRNRAPVC
jgi:hypothetical protein